ncbi:MAG: aminopeptidase P family protein [Sedimentisphaerales bacterium]|nr:aminopeptidase P family protein [Sedimentisphaerales bacterium]
MKKEAIQKRLRALRAQMAKRKVNCLILARPANVTYTTGFLGDDSWAVVSKNRVYLITDSRYIEQARGECPDCKLIERKRPMVEAVGKLMLQLKSISKVEVESSISLKDYRALRKHLDVSVRGVSGIVERLRSCKGAEEVAAVRGAAKIAAKAFNQTIKKIRTGVTESELAGILELEIRRLGGRISFDTIVAFGGSASYPHYQPGLRKLRKADTILIDFGVRFQGYCCDITRCFSTGTVTNRFKRIYRTAELAQAAAIGKVKAGVDIRQIDEAARAVIKDSNLPVYGHGTGHGLGLEVHELPMISPKAEGRLKTGQIITIEPGVYIHKKIGVRIEDDILVTDSGCEILTRQCPKSNSLNVLRR